MKRFTIILLALASLLGMPIIAVAAAQTSGETVHKEGRRLSVDSPLGELLGDAKARAILKRALPLLLSSPQIARARTLSLRSLQHYAPALITDAKLKAINTALAHPGAVSSDSNSWSALGKTPDPQAAFRLKTIRLWDGPAPGAKGNGPEDTPTLTVIGTGGTPAFGTAVIVAPGGGYRMLATGAEGRQVGDWFAAHGIVAFVLRYRLCSAGYRFPAPLQDARRAIRWVRAHAEDYGINPHRIGMIGFSAGGHLTAMAETLFDKGNPDASDPVDRVSSRPDFAVLAYAAVGSADKGWKPACLAGPHPDARTSLDLAPYRNVSPQTPPTFIFHSDTDRLVSPRNATRFFNALHAAKVPVELHIFGEGRHGMGLALTDPSVGVWPSLLATWLRDQHFIGDNVSPVGGH